jgi:hypothetical protein
MSACAVAAWRKVGVAGQERRLTGIKAFEGQHFYYADIHS